MPIIIKSVRENESGSILSPQKSLDQFINVDAVTPVNILIDQVTLIKESAFSMNK